MNIQLPSFEDFIIKPCEIQGDECFLIQPKGFPKWDNSNKWFRSSIFTKNLRPVSLGWRKFTNYGEQPEFEPLNLKYKLSYFDKRDGSLLIVSKYKGQLIIRTRGTTDATQLDNGYEIEFLKAKYPLVFQNSYLESEKYSILLEWETLTNIIVLRKVTEPTLFLLGLVDHSDYSYITQNKVDEIAKELQVERPKRYEFSSFEEMLEKVPKFNNEEGVVIYGNNDQVLKKVKSEFYLKLHRLKDELGSFERVVDFYFTNNRPSYLEMYNLIAETLDFEVAEQCKADISRITEGMKEVDKLVAAMKERVEPLKTWTRKDAALEILQAYGNTNRSGMAFKLLDSRSLEIDDVKKLLYQVLKK